MTREQLMPILDAFERDARAAWKALGEALGRAPWEAYGDHSRPRRGAGFAQGRRMVWRFHGAGVYIHWAPLRPVDFDFRTDGAESDLWKLASCGRIQGLDAAQIARLVSDGAVAPGGRYTFHLETP